MLERRNGPLNPIAEPALRADGRAPCLRVFTLGPAWIEWQGEILQVRRRQARALLYCLASKREPVPREELCFGLWPDEPEITTHRHLSHLITHLRDALPKPELLRGTNDSLELDPRGVWCDAAEFRSACSIQHGPSMDLLEHAVELYRGPFLSGFSLPSAPEYELWMSEQRTWYERMYLDALAALIDIEAYQANYAKAITYARRYLKVDDLSEEVHRRLMVLHIMSGDRPAALQQYEQCRTILKRELGLEPLPETRAIYDAVMQNA